MKKFLILIIIIVAILIFGSILVRSFYYFPSDEVPIPLSVAEKTAINIPPSIKSVSEIRLIIPKISVNAKIEELGITKKGNMAAPKIFSEVGWYKYGTFPGSMGSAVIAGHVDNGVALPAVFNNLKNLDTGDDVYVQIEEGNRLHFIVTGFKTYDFNSAPAEVFSENDGKFLKLITCTGNWIQELRTHDKRLVVSAVLVE